MNNLINIENKDGVLTVSSRDIAERFEKQHKHVLESIENIKAENSAMTYSYFIETSYKAGTGKSYKEYLLTRDGFSLLAMGFTGSKALGWKLKYIEAFNKMEEEIKSRSLPSGQNLIALALIEADKIIQEKDNTIKVQDQLIGEMKPKVDYVDDILKNDSLLKITAIAKDYGMSGQQMNKLLHEMGIQYKSGDQWLLYANYQASGYTHSETISFFRRNGKPGVKLITKWTMKGRLFLYEKLKARGIIPVIEQEYKEAK